MVGWETFAGTISYHTTFVLANAPLKPLFLDLGGVGDIAEILVNDEVVAICAWAPYVVRIDPWCQQGENRLTIRVTNSIANYYEGLQRPSGLLGPVVLRAAGQ
jgi:hypothetical protein